MTGTVGSAGTADRTGVGRAAALGSTAGLTGVAAYDTDAAAGRLARGFAAQVARWSRERNAPPASAAAAMRAAEAVSLATDAGHTCAQLQQAFSAEDPERVRALLLESAVVTTPQCLEQLPLVLDDDRIYLHRYFDYERRLAARLLAAASRPPMALQPGAAQRLVQWFAHAKDREPPVPDWQRVAAALALRRRLTVISGGPGTGKTTTVVHLLACLIEEQPGCRIALAAPTGKAAARMIEAVRTRMATLPEHVCKLLPTEARTIHRLLGVGRRGDGRRGDGFRHHAGNRLPIDMLIVDEASMLDLALATHLLEAVPEDARILLVGDKDQLAAVEAGAVFGEVSADPSLDQPTRHDIASLCGIQPASLRPPAPETPTPLANTTVWLTETHRFAEGSDIGALAAAIRAGDAAAVEALLRTRTGGSLRWLAGEADLLVHLQEGFAPFIDALRTAPADVATVMRAFDAFRVLCAVRQGRRGVERLNLLCEAMLRSALALPGQASPAAGARTWYLGRPVMVMRNDYLVKVFNGDVGITLPDETGGLQVWFPGPDASFRPVAPARLPLHETAFAITVHKSQGSEFDRVVVVLPEERSPVVSRELLYTAATRAREEVAVCASAAVLEAAVSNPTRRHSGLIERLREAQAITEGAGVLNARS